MTIRLTENFRAVFYAPFYAAHATGAYERAGVAVTLQDSPDPAAAARALRAGDADVMWGGPLRVLLARDADPASDLVCFCDGVARDPFFVLGREPRPDFRLADLAGVTLGSVAEVPTPWLCLADDLRRDGVDPASVRRVSGPSMAANAQALRDGGLDAVQLFQPCAEALLASGAGHLWYAAASRGPTAYTALVTRRATLDARAPELLAMTRAMAATLRWMAATPGEASRGRAGAVFPRPRAAAAGRRAGTLPDARPVGGDTGGQPRGFRAAACGDAGRRRAASRDRV